MRILIAGGSEKGYQSRRLQEEAAKRGHRADVGGGKSLLAFFDGANVIMTVGGEDILSYDVMRILSTWKNRALWLTAAMFMQKHGKAVDSNVVLTVPSAFTSASSEYLRAQELGIRIPKSFVTISVQKAAKAAEELGYPCVIKTTNSRQGIDVGLVRDEKEISAFFAARDRAHTTFVMREYIPNDGDIRVLVIGGKVFGAMQRVPKAGDFRANISQGGRGALFNLDARPDIAEMAERAAHMCGYAIAGVDIMIHKHTGDAYLLEVNDAPQIEGFEKYTGLNAAEAMVKYFETLVPHDL